MSLELKRLELGKEATLVNTLNRILDNNQIVGVLDECGALQVSFGVRDYSTRLGACDGTRLNTVVEYSAMISYAVSSTFVKNGVESRSRRKQHWILWWTKIGHLRLCIKRRSV
ncbi:hypothetical protein C6341_g7185 [Phytophthora cactorum]|uniref:Uncharacterized protein n=1 Tax=Phytophthora cactorum TaxID=29920 RepID=A0A8T1ARS9_9STRA|nr:hypothetical protein PC117_g25587 [Phytophthora cactorum]KAG3179946.1 hypothetical protein C6341_g7185 [Phytophthora cactorum]